MVGFLKSKGHTYWPIALLFFYLGNVTFGFPSGDVIPASVLPFALLIHHSFYIGKYIIPTFPSSSYFLRAVKGHYISAYPIGAAITALPFYIPYVIAGGIRNLASAAVLQKLASATIAVGATLLMNRLLNYVKIDRTITIIYTILFAIGTEMFAIGSQGLWQHGIAVFWYLASLLSLFKLLNHQVKNRQYWLLFSGFTGGMVVLTRPVDLMLLLPIFIWLIIWRKLPLHEIGVIFFAALIPLFGLAFYDKTFFGSIQKTGYGSLQRVAHRFSFPLLGGILGNLFSPSKGWVIYSPLLFVFVGGIGRLASREFWSSIFAPLLVSFLILLIIYASFFQWPAGFSFGPRYMTDLVPDLTLMSAAYLNSISSKLQNAKKFVAPILVLLSIWSIGIQFVGTYVPQGAGAWITAVRPNTFEKPLWSLANSQYVYAFKTIFYSFQPVVPIKDPNVKITSLTILDKPYLYRQGHPISTLKAGVLYRGKAKITNFSSQSLLAFPQRGGVGEVHFTYIVFTQSGNPFKMRHSRTALLRSLHPGQSEWVYFRFTAPLRSGKYFIVFTLVQENVQWFQTKLNPHNAFIKKINVLP